MKRRTEDLGRDVTVVLAWLGVTIGAFLVLQSGARHFLWDYERRYQNAAAYLILGIVSVVGVIVWRWGPTVDEGD